MLSWPRPGAFPCGPELLRSGPHMSETGRWPFTGEHIVRDAICCSDLSWRCRAFTQKHKSGARFYEPFYGLLKRHVLTGSLTASLRTKIRWLKPSGQFPMGLGIPPLEIKIMLESNPLKSRILVRRMAVLQFTGHTLYGRMPKAGHRILVIWGSVIRHSVP